MMFLTRRFIFTALLLWLNTLTSAWAHGGLSMDEDVCKLRVGRYLMHFAGYQPESTAAKEFCEDIPSVGPTVVVLDYIDAELRDMPAEVRIIRDTGSEQDLDAITVLHVPPKVYPTGSLSFEHKFDAPGKFVGLVSIGDKQKSVSRFPFSVGGGMPIWHYVVSIVAALAVAVGFYAFAMRKQRRTARQS